MTQKDWFRLILESVSDECLCQLSESLHTVRYGTDAETRGSFIAAIYSIQDERRKFDDRIEAVLKRQKVQS